MDLSTTLTLAFLIAAGMAEAICQKNTKRRTPTLTLAVCALLTACLLAQLKFPALLPHLERNTTQVFHGEWWRPITALFFQDGWIIGGVTNIAALFYIGTLFEQRRSRADWLLISFTGALAAECLALRWQPIGAGNSIATCSLAGYLITHQCSLQMPTASNFLRTLAGTLCLLLVLTTDIHGVAATTGILLGFARSNRPDV